jgi:hypothetical protein
MKVSGMQIHYFFCQHHQNLAQYITASLQRGLHEGATRTKPCPKTGEKGNCVEESWKKKRNII